MYLELRLYSPKHYQQTYIKINRINSKIVLTVYHPRKYLDVFDVIW